MMVYPFVSFRALEDIFDGTQVIKAGTVFTVPGTWTPPSGVEPVDQGALESYWRQGVQLLGRVAVKPSVYWAAVPGTSSSYQLTGSAGAALGPRQLNSTSTFIR
jgi:hypothetical protein